MMMEKNIITAVRETKLQNSKTPKHVPKKTEENKISSSGIEENDATALNSGITPSNALKAPTKKKRKKHGYKNQLKIQKKNVEDLNKELLSKMEENKKFYEKQIRTIKEEYDTKISSLEKSLQDALKGINFLSIKVEESDKVKKSMEAMITNDKEIHKAELEKVIKTHKEKSNFFIKKFVDLEKINKLLSEQQTAMMAEDEHNKESIKKTEREIKRVRGINEEMKKAICDCKEDLQIKVDALNAARSVNFNMSEDVKKLQEKIFLGNEKLQNLEEQNNTKSIEIKDLKKSLGNVMQELSDEKNEMRLIKEKMSKSKIYNENLTKKLESVNLEFQQKIMEQKKFDEEFENIKQELQVQRDQLKCCEKDNKTLLIDQMHLNREKNSLQLELDEARKQLAKIKKAGLLRRLFKRYK